MSRQILAYLVILCLEKRRPKQEYSCSPKIKHFGPLKKFGMATPPLQNIEALAKKCRISKRFETVAKLS